MTDTAHRKAFSVRFNELDRWNVAYFRSINWRWPRKFIRPIGETISRVQELVNLKPEDSPIIEKISFGGDLSILERDKRVDYKGRLFKAKSGQLIYSKIRVKQGSVCIIPPSVDWVAVSSEYPVYEINHGIANAGYLDLVLRSSSFKHYLEGLSHGGSTKTRIHPTQFEALSIPMPPLTIQHKIVAYWEAAEACIRESESLSKKTKKKAFDSFRNALGLSTTINVDKPRLFTANWSQTDRWGLDLVWRNKKDTDSYAYPTKLLKEVCRTGSGGTPNRKHKEYFGGTIPWVKTTEIRNNVVNDTEEKITPLGLNSCSAKVYPAGSIVVAMYGQGATRGRTAKLGIEASTNQACLVISEMDEVLDSDFLWYYLMISYETMRSLASGNNQPNLSAELIGGFPVPIPPKKEQNELKKFFEEAQLELSRLHSHMDEIRTRTSKELEQMILGILPVEDI